MEWFRASNRPLWVAVSAIVLIGIIIAVVFITVPRASMATPDAVHIIVTQQSLKQRSTVIFEQQNTQSAQQLYHQITAVPLADNAVQSCPAIRSDTGYLHYTLIFTQKGALVATAQADALGCQDISITFAGGVHKTYFWNSTQGSFWQSLHDLTGAPLTVQDQT